MDQARINDLRQRILAGERPTTEELAEAIKTLRQNRITAGAQSASATTAKRKRAGKQTDAEAAAELDSLLGNLGL
jgi:adenosine deaminase